MLYNNSAYVCLYVCLSEADWVPELLRPPPTHHLLSYHFYLILPPHLIFSSSPHHFFFISPHLLLISSSYPPQFIPVYSPTPHQHHLITSLTPSFLPIYISSHSHILLFSSSYLTHPLLISSLFPPETLRLCD